MDTRPDEQKSKLALWLDNLMQESWQLEMIISGFVIFLLLGVYEPLIGLREPIVKLAMGSDRYFGLMIPWIIVVGGWAALLINLLVHVLFRGLWISAVGLRYISGDIDHDALPYQPRFTRFLNRRIGSFDEYIERLEKICSALFAFTFLVLFCILSVGCFFGFIILVSWGINQLRGVEGSNVNDFVAILFLFLGLIYLIDFLTLGKLKKIKWFTPFYYPLYRFFGFITLARLYRPMYYNLIDNRYGRRLGFLLVPYVFLLIIGSSIYLSTDAYFPARHTTYSLSTEYYDDTAEGDTRIVPTMPSRWVKNGFLEVFIPYLPKWDDRTIEVMYPDLTPARFKGTKLRGVVTMGAISNRKADTDSLFLAMTSLYRLSIDDSLRQNVNWYFYHHPQYEDNGMLGVIDVADLPRGAHQLKVEAYRIGDTKRSVVVEDSLSWRVEADIPFLKE